MIFCDQYAKMAIKRRKLPKNQAHWQWPSRYVTKLVTVQWSDRKVMITYYCNLTDRAVAAVHRSEVGLGSSRAVPYAPLRPERLQDSHLGSCIQSWIQVTRTTAADCSFNCLKKLHNLYRDRLISETYEKCEVLIFLKKIVSREDNFWNLWKKRREYTWLLYLYLNLQLSCSSGVNTRSWDPRLTQWRRRVRMCCIIQGSEIS